MTIKPGPAKHLVIFVDDGDLHDGRPVHDIILEILIENNIAGATLFRGISGYGSDGIVHTSKLLSLTESLPLKIEALDLGEKIDAVLPKICEVVKKGLVAVSETQIVHSRF